MDYRALGELEDEIESYYKGLFERRSSRGIDDKFVRAVFRAVGASYFKRAPAYGLDPFDFDFYREAKASFLGIMVYVDSHFGSKLDPCIEKDILSSKAEPDMPLSKLNLTPFQYQLISSAMSYLWFLERKGMVEAVIGDEQSIADLGQKVKRNFCEIAEDSSEAAQYQADAERLYSVVVNVAQKFSEAAKAGVTYDEFVESRLGAVINGIVSGEG